jgi:hypothetical protein
MQTVDMQIPLMHFSSLVLKVLSVHIHPDDEKCNVLWNLAYI